MLYRLLAPFIKLIVRVFFRSVEVHGRERIPQNRPILFAANHPNMAYDPIMVALAHDRRVHFLGKAGLFKFPPMAWMLRGVGAIPVYRRSDNPADTAKNREAFAECYRVLEEGDAIGIFPEGTSLDTPRLLPLKTGAARIVFEAEEKNAFGLGVMVVPVGLHFVERNVFRSDVLVQVGEPIDPSQYFEKYKTDASAAVHALTEKIEAGLLGLTRNLQANQDARLIEQLRRIYVQGFLGAEPDTAPPADLKEAFDVDRGLIEAHAWFSQNQPERVRRAERLLERYMFMIDWMGVSDRVVGAPPGAGQLARAALLEVPLLFFIGLPLMLYASVTSYLPYRLVGIIADRSSTDRVEIASYKTALGMLLFPIWYAVLAALVWAVGGAKLALLALLSFPIAGLAALPVTERMDKLASGLRTATMHRRDRDRLKSLRDRIVAELRAMRQEWLARPAPDAGGRSTAA